MDDEKSINEEEDLVDEQDEQDEQDGSGSAEPDDELFEDGDETGEPDDKLFEDGDEAGEPDDEFFEDGDETGEPDDKLSEQRPGLVNPEYTRKLPISLLSALAGAVAGTLIMVLFVLITGIKPYPLFAATPLLAYLFNRLLKGGRDIRTLIFFAVISLAAAYPAARAAFEHPMESVSPDIARPAALYVRLFPEVSAWKIPSLTMQSLRVSGIWPASASTHIYMLIFTALGLFLAWILMRDEPALEEELEEEQQIDAV